MSPSKNEQTYRKFVVAALAGDDGKARLFVAPEFTASMNAYNTGLTFPQYMDEIRRQRRAFPGLGEEISDLNFSDEVLSNGESRLVATYVMTVRFTRVLRDERNNSLMPTGKVAKIAAQIHMAFTKDGKIAGIEVVTDLSDTIRQLL